MALGGQLSGSLLHAFHRPIRTNTATAELEGVPRRCVVGYDRCMETLQFVLLQLDEAKAYLRSGTLPHLRVGLLLLDNAIELQLYRWAVQQMRGDSLVRRLQDNVRQWGAPSDVLGELKDYEVLQPKDEQSVLRDFNKLVQYAAEIRKAIQPEVGELLIHLHRYRNEAHHRGEIRPATLKSAVLLLFAINCRLLSDLQSLVNTYSSGADYSWIERRFNVRPIELLGGGDALQRIVTDLLDGLPEAVVSENLATQLESRAAEVRRTMTFLVENARDVVDDVTAFSKGKEYVMGSTGADIRTRMPRNLPNISIAVLTGLLDVAAKIRSATSPEVAFRIFGKAEAELEAVEFAVRELAMVVESAIQFQIDLARGK